MMENPFTADSHAGGEVGHTDDGHCCHAVGVVMAVKAGLYVRPRKQCFSSVGSWLCPFLAAVPISVAGTVISLGRGCNKIK